jgi:hypothetical protein
MNKWANKLSVVAIILAVTIALSPVATAYALAASTGAVMGSVRSANTGVALANVTVRVFDMNTAEYVSEVVTNDEGVLDLSELPFGLYQITAVAPEGYLAGAGPLVSLNEENPAATVEFALEAAPGTAAPAAQFGGGLGLLLIGGAIIGVTTGIIIAVTGTP